MNEPIARIFSPCRAAVAGLHDSRVQPQRRAKTYTLTPGAAYVYNEGDLHSPRRESSTRLIRFEGRNMDSVQRLRYEAV